MVGSLSVVVSDFDGRIHYGAIVLVDSASEVDVFGVHKETGVE